MFEFPEIPRKKDFKFKNNLLRSATFQIKYPKNENVSSKIDDLQKVINDDFPIKKPIFLGFAQLKFEKGKTPIMDSGKSTESGNEFRAKDGKKIVHLTNDTFTYTISGEIYSNFENTYEEINKFFIPFLKNIGIKTLNRVAIRKINLMEAKDSLDTDDAKLLGGALKESLINHFLNLPGLANLESGASNFQLRKENYQLNLSYGLLPKNPESKNRGQILLDIDLFGDYQKLTIEEIGSEWLKFNNEIFNIFNWAVNEEVISNL